jgi:hypothetical protein
MVNIIILYSLHICLVDIWEHVNKTNTDGVLKNKCEAKSFSYTCNMGL